MNDNDDLGQYVAKLEADNAALRRWSAAWKQTAKLHRGFYQIMEEKAREWQGKCFKSEAENDDLRREISFEREKKIQAYTENAALRQRVQELEAEIAKNATFLAVHGIGTMEDKTISELCIRDSRIAELETALSIICTNLTDTHKFSEDEDQRYLVDICNRAMSEEAAQDLAQSHSEGAGGGVYTVGGMDTETRA